MGKARPPRGPAIRLTAPSWQSRGRGPRDRARGRHRRRWAGRRLPLGPKLPAPCRPGGQLTGGGPPPPLASTAASLHHEAKGRAGGVGFMQRRAASHASPQGESIPDALLAWYDRERRHLPWRAAPHEAPAPYRVWLSEIMLQQTTVKAVKARYAVFLRRWPDVKALAKAELGDVLAAWAGLGYYARARNLHACARAVVAHHGGRVPADEAALRKLPGIGDYTAAAPSAIAFGKRAPPGDGNIERVGGRLFALTTPLPEAKPEIRAFAESLTPAKRPGDFAQSMMDLGATICTPRRPACRLCLRRARCRGSAAGLPPGRA